ncbi:MAG: AraC family transcriptional regulator [Gorillibacterium sp.]|nr:AraC family transcriptional regulator [Gorillibacterium sp.]
MKDQGELVPIDALFTIDLAKRTDDFNMDQHHFHNAWEIYFLLSGERCYFIKDRAYHVRKGDLILIPVHALHKTTSTRKGSHERILINFRKEAIGNLLPQWEAEVTNIFAEFPLLRLNQKEQGVVRTLMTKMLTELEIRQTGHEAYTKLLLSELLITLLRLTEGRPTEIADYPNSLHYKVSEVAQYIGKHYAETLTLGQLSGLFHISPFYLSRIFTQVTGLSIISYINHVRVEEARKLLQETDLSVTEIALQVGYQSVTHFGRVFKTAMGASPQKYRKNR